MKKIKAFQGLCPLTSTGELTALPRLPAAILHAFGMSVFYFPRNRCTHFFSVLYPDYGSTVFSNDLQIEKEAEQEAEEVKIEEEVSITKPIVGGIVVVKYAAERKSLQYLGIVQSISGEKLYVQFLKSSGGKTYSLKANDCDEIDVKCVLSVIKNFSVNIRGQYIVHMDYNLDM